MTVQDQNKNASNTDPSVSSDQNQNSNVDIDNQNGGGASGDKVFTQEEVNRIVQERLSKEKKKQEEKLEEERKKAQMSEAERLKAERDEAERKANEAIQKANKRLIETETKLQATALGIKPEKQKYVFKLIDLSDVEVDEDGTVDSSVIESKLKELVKDMPELKGGDSPTKNGADFSTNSNSNSGKGKQSFADIINNTKRKRR